MDSIRRRLRAVAAVWLLWQTASLAAFVPVDCCASHRPAPVETEASCHRVPPPPTECPMRAPDGTPCPMHRGGHASHDAASHDVAPAGRQDGCRMTSACDGPGEALLAVFAYHGVTSERAPFDPDLRIKQNVMPNSTTSRPLASPPDAPPPRN